MDSQIFWFVATVTCALALGFAFKQRGSVADGETISSAELAKSQEKDNWLTCVVVWGVIFGGHTEFAPEFQLVGAVVLGWTGWRTLRRVALLPRSHTG